MPRPDQQSRIWWYGNGRARYFLARDANFDLRHFDPARFEARMRELSAQMDAADPDLSAFVALRRRLSA
jgi:feruloyl esterase